MDGSLEALARTWAQSRNPTDELRFLQAQQQRGVLRRASVEAAAWLGDAVARRMLGERGAAFQPPSDLERLLQLLPGGEAVRGQAALGLLHLLKHRAAEQANEHEVGQKIMRALDTPSTPTVERMLTAHAAAKRTVEELWTAIRGVVVDCLPGEDGQSLTRMAIQRALYPWVLVRPDPGGEPLSAATIAHPLFDRTGMTLDAARAVLTVRTSWPLEDVAAKELIRDYLVARGWSRDIGGLVAPGKAQRLKFDMPRRRLVLSAGGPGQWVEEQGPPLGVNEVAAWLIPLAEDVLRVANEPHPPKRAPRARRRKAGESRRASWTMGGMPTLGQLDQIAELSRGMSDEELLTILKEKAQVESVGHLGRDTAGAVILALSGF